MNIKPGAALLLTVAALTTLVVVLQ